MNIMKKLVIAILMLGIISILTAEDNNHAASYIRMGVGARALSMGSAYTAISNDVTSAYWNPAGLANLKDMELSFMYAANMANDCHYNYAGFGQRLSHGTYAISWVNAGTDDIEGYTDDNQATGYFNNNDHNIALSYGATYKKLHYGASAKLYYSKQDNDTETGTGLDLGFQYDWNQYVVVGAMMRDLYGKSGGDTVPYQLSAGVALYPFLGLTVTTDVKQEKGYDPNVYFGAEYKIRIGKDTEADSKLNRIRFREKNAWQDALANTSTSLRAGFADGNLTVGGGLEFKTIMVDYAYLLSDSDINTDSHRLSLVIRF